MTGSIRSELKFTWICISSGMKSFILLIFWSKFHIAAQERAATSDLTPSNCALCQCFRWFPPYKIALCQFSEGSILSFFSLFSPPPCLRIVSFGIVEACIEIAMKKGERKSWLAIPSILIEKNNPIGRWSVGFFFWSVNSSYFVCLY